MNTEEKKEILREYILDNFQGEIEEFALENDEYLFEGKENTKERFEDNLMQ